MKFGELVDKFFPDEYITVAIQVDNVVFKSTNFASTWKDNIHFLYYEVERCWNSDGGFCVRLNVKLMNGDE